MGKESRDDMVLRRIYKLEERTKRQGERIENHDALLLDIHQDIGRLVEQVKGVRSALYVMAVVILGNVPALQPILSSLKEVFRP